MYLMSALIVLLYLSSSVTATFDSYMTVRKAPFRSVYFSDDTHGWIAGYRGVFYTQDGGASWRRQRVSIGSTSRFTTNMAMRNTGSIAWADRDEAIISSDEGIVSGNATSGRWRKIRIPTDVLQNLVAVVFTNQQEGWGVGDQAYHTTDGGKTWTARRTPTDDLLKSVCAVSSSEIWVVGNANVLLHTTDKGNTWEKQLVGEATITDFVSVRFLTPEEGWIAGLHGLLFRTTDGGKKWKREEVPLAKYTGLMRLSFASSNHGWVLAAARSTTLDKYQGLILKTNDAGVHWETQLTDIDGWFLDICVQGDGRVWVIREDGSVFRTLDHGKSWSEVKIE